MPGSRPLRAGLALTSLLAWATQAAAAEISIEPTNAPSSALIAVDGTLVPEDIDQFRSKVAGIKNAAVLFRGDGGSVLAAIRIGRYIRLKNWISFVPANTTCASACALAWLGGSRRLANATARIGFHAAHTIKGGQVTETGLGNAMVGAYLNELGLSDEAIVYITSAEPTSMRWLTAGDAATFGIELETLPTRNTEPPSAASEPDLERTLEQRTANYISSIMTSWSGSNAHAAAALQQIYGTEVTYYGKLLTREDVLADKQKFIELWPHRKYMIRHPSVVTSCTNPCQDCKPICTVTGTVDWVASNANNAKSQGSAQFEYRVQWSDQEMPTIIHETSKVIERTARPK
jgi:hypothetical protein